MHPEIIHSNLLALFHAGSRNGFLISDQRLLNERNEDA